MDRWRLHYNHRRIQRALGKVTPAVFAGTRPALPSLRLASLARAAAPPGMEGGVSTMLQLSKAVWTDESDPVTGPRHASSHQRHRETNARPSPTLHFAASPPRN